LEDRKDQCKGWRTGRTSARAGGQEGPVQELEDRKNECKGWRTGRTSKRTGGQEGPVKGMEDRQDRYKVTGINCVKYLQ
jgi:hypothetical protein